MTKTIWLALSGIFLGFVISLALFGYLTVMRNKEEPVAEEVVEEVAIDPFTKFRGEVIDSCTKDNPAFSDFCNCSMDKVEMRYKQDYIMEVAATEDVEKIKTILRESADECRYLVPIENNN